jgi:hypothetical protein
MLLISVYQTLGCFYMWSTHSYVRSPADIFHFSEIANMYPCSGDLGRTFYVLVQSVDIWFIFRVHVAESTDPAWLQAAFSTTGSPSCALVVRIHTPRVIIRDKFRTHNFQSGEIACTYLLTDTGGNPWPPPVVCRCVESVACSAPAPPSLLCRQASRRDQEHGEQIMCF